MDPPIDRTSNKSDSVDAHAHMPGEVPFCATKAAVRVMNPANHVFLDVDAEC